MRPGAYETAVGRQVFLSPHDLARCRENTLQLLARGWVVPVFVGHVEYASGQGGPRLEAPRDSPRWLGRQNSSTAVGRLVDVTLEPDGSLAHVLYIKRKYIAQLRRARLRFTSPEVRSAFTPPSGEKYGPIIAHVALTRWPLCRGQSRLTLVRAAKEANGFDNAFTKGNEMTNEQATTPETEVPEAEIGAREIDLPSPATTPETDEPAAPQLPETDRVALAERIRRSRKLPRGLRERLCEFVETLQFSADAQSEPVVPVAEAVSMIEAAVPEHLQLDDEEELEVSQHPRGEDFFRGPASQMSDEEADRIAAEQLAASGFGPTA
jgi:hypothetical protein